VDGKRLSIAVLFAASSVALTCTILDTPATPFLFGAAVMAVPPALIGLGVARNGRVGSLRGPLLLFALLLQLCLAAMLALSGRTDPAEWWLGLPPATVVMFCGLWLFPLVLVPLIYARHFEREGLTEEDLRRFRELARRTREGGEVR